MADEQAHEEGPAQGQTMGEYIQEQIRLAMADDAPDIPEVPKVDHRPETGEEAADLGKMLAGFRKEIFQLRQELRARAGRATAPAGPTETVEERTNRRLEAIAEASHYCPGCGSLYQYPQRCTGPLGGHPHAPIEVVSTEELGGDPENHTKAPATDPDGLAALAA